jgi:hypothetical protein
VIAADAGDEGVQRREVAPLVRIELLRVAHDPADYVPDLELGGGRSGAVRGARKGCR